MYVPGTGNGFSFTAPADTTPRRLIVHVGGYLSGGRLTAHLSDGSAVDYTDLAATSTDTVNNYDRNYTLTYRAGSAGQTLLVTWVMTSGSSNVTVSAAALAVVGGPASITATAGTPQSTVINTAFATALQATVRDAGGAPVSGVTVTFAAPGSGASASFGGSTSVTTDGSGVATAATLTANGTTGSYSVTASVAGVATPATFSLTNTASGGGSPTLSGTVTTSTANANLTTEGPRDWVHWGDSSLTRKANVTPQLSTYAVVGSGAVTTYSNDLRGLAWTDGTPTVSASNNRRGLSITAIGNGFSFTAPADGATRTLVVHVGGSSSGGTLTAHLSDGSAVDFTNVSSTVSGRYDRNYTLTYRAGSPGQTLTVTWKMTSGTGTVTLSGAALSIAP
jgi:hypothetical protein